MNLIELYIHEVTRRLPEKSREDIGLELRSTIEDMLPDHYSEEDVKTTLAKLGNPALLASRYRDQPMHLIGPRYFDVYVSLLKMILPIAVVITFIAMIGEYVSSYSGETAVMNVVITLIGEGIARMIDVAFQTFAWLTLVFAVIERVDKDKEMQPLTTSLHKWTPDDLKKIHHVPKKKSISKFEVFGSLLWTAIWATFYFNADHLVGVYRDTENGMAFVLPSLNQEVLLSYWPIILVVIGLGVAYAIYKLIKGHWTTLMAIFNTVNEVVGTVVLIIIISNPNLMLPQFLEFMSNLFHMTPEQFRNSVVGGVIFVSIVFTVWNVFDGFRKSRIR